MPDYEEDHENEHYEEEEPRIEKKRGKDLHSTLFFGLVVILAGVLLFLKFQGILEWGDWWAYFLLGTGCILMIDAIVSCASHTHRKLIFGKVFWGLILICIGACKAYGLKGWWPLLIVVVGVLIIVSGFERARRPK
jgi:hypothetical protein